MARTKTIPVTGDPVRDPYCKITDPGHVCRRRDGQVLTGTNGDCHAWAALQSRRCTCHTIYGCEAHGPQPRDHAVPCSWCMEYTFAVEGVCANCLCDHQPLPGLYRIA